MKTQPLRKIGRLSLVAFFLGAAGTTLAQQASYEFRLRGESRHLGQTLRILMERGTNSQFIRMVVSFQFGTSPAGQGLEPGQGSWLDRGMRPKEPVRMEGDVPRNLAEQVAESLNDPNAYWSFWIYNTNNGYFQITRPPAPFGNTKVPPVPHGID
jgi:hypothetical protein